MSMHLFALVVEHGATVVKRLPVSRPLQNDLTTLFRQQAAQFLDDDLERIEFDGRYQVDESELFVVTNYNLDAQIVDAVKHPTQLDELDLNNLELRIKSLFAGEFDAASDRLTVYFQAFNKSHLLAGGFTILHQQHTFQRLTDPGLTLDTKLAAAYVDGNLYFSAYRTANGIVDLTEYFKEATNEEITDVLDHDGLHVEDQQAVVDASDSWMRRRFAALRASKILDTVKPRKIATRAKKFGLNFSTRRVDGKETLVFPTDKKDMKGFLTFLNEGYFEGELTGTLFQTNSQRAVAAAK